MTNIIDEAVRDFVQVSKENDADEVAALELEAEQMLKVEAKFLPDLCKSWLDHQFPRIDTSFLSRTESDRTPSFAVFDLDDPICKILYDSRYDSRIYGMHYLWRDHQEKNLLALLQKSVDEHGIEEFDRNSPIRETNYYKKVSLSCSFPGRIPGDVRQKVLETKERYNSLLKNASDQLGYTRYEYGKIRSDSKYNVASMVEICDASISIVTEAPEWQLNVESVIENLDPLVILSACGENWLIEQFDVTPMENIAAREFSVRYK